MSLMPIGEMGRPKKQQTFKISEELLDRIESILFRISSEQVPLFGSNRLKNLHAECGQLIHEIRLSIK